MGLCDFCIGIPTVPQREHDIHDIGSAGIALSMIGHRIEAEVQSFKDVGGRDDIPSRPAAADMIKGGEAPREVEWMIEGG